MTRPQLSAPQIIAPLGCLGAAADSASPGMIGGGATVLAAGRLCRVGAHFLGGRGQADELRGRWRRGLRGYGARMTPEPAIMLVLACLGAQAVGDLGPGFRPASGAHDGAQGDHGVEVVAPPAHAAALEPGLHHHLPGALHRPAADGVALGEEVGIL